MRKTIIKSGDKFGRLTAVRFSHIDKEQYWKFQCECGEFKIIRLGVVKRGRTKSCGCLQSEAMKKMRKHGMTRTKTYHSWIKMRERCFKKDNHNYKYYGGRGITICDRWFKFENFFADMGGRPEGKTLDRIDNNLGYYKSNCKWSTQKQQCNNTRRNVFLTYNNETLTIAEWSTKLEIPYKKIHKRLYLGWSVEKALTFNL